MGDETFSSGLRASEAVTSIAGWGGSLGSKPACFLILASDEDSTATTEISRLEGTRFVPQLVLSKESGDWWKTKRSTAGLVTTPSQQRRIQVRPSIVTANACRSKRNSRAPITSLFGPCGRCVSAQAACACYHPRGVAHAATALQ